MSGATRSRQIGWKIVTLNLLADVSDWQVRRPLLMAGLRALAPDVIALQEANLHVHTAEDLAAGLGLPHLNLIPKTGPAPSEGLAVLSRWPIVAAAWLDLGSQERVAQRVTVVRDGAYLSLANVHLFWQPGDVPERLLQVLRLQAWLAADRPQLVVGDFNSAPPTSSIRQMRRDGWRSAYASLHGREPRYTAPTPLRRSLQAILQAAVTLLPHIRWSEFTLTWRETLDYIFVDAGVTVCDAQVVLDQSAPGRPHTYPSDHFGICAIVQTDL
jgi:endonuclease/exonuclease/phosphatase family metal-dependent hydrolase